MTPMPNFLCSYVNVWLFGAFSLLCTHIVCSCSLETSSASFSFLYFKFTEFSLLGFVDILQQEALFVLGEEERMDN